MTSPCEGFTDRAPVAVIGGLGVTGDACWRRDGAVVECHIHLTEEPSSITCPDCDRTSHDPYDIRHGYCGNCHTYTGLDPGHHDPRPLG